MCIPFDKISSKTAHSEQSSSHTILLEISLAVSPSSAHCARRRVSEANRAACAAAAGIPDYTGTPEQDAALLDALGAGTRPWATTLQGA